MARPPGSPQGGWVGKFGGLPAVHRRMAGEPAKTTVCENAIHGVALTFRVQRGKGDPVQGAILQYLTLTLFFP
jgi:hypothetical protein